LETFGREPRTGSNSTMVASSDLRELICETEKDFLHQERLGENISKI